MQSAASLSGRGVHHPAAARLAAPGRLPRRPHGLHQPREPVGSGAPFGLCRHPRQQQQQQQQQQRLGTPPQAAAQPLASPGGLSTFAVLNVLVTVALGISNRVLYKLALVPMSYHVFFLAQLQVFGYILVYFSLLALRYRAGKVTPAMLAIPKLPFLLIGACEALAQLLLMVGAAKLPAPMLPLLMQTSMIWSLLFARLILGTRFQLPQVLGCLLVLGGVLLAAAPSGASSMQVDPRYAALLVMSFAFPSLAVILKERVFKSAEVALGGQKLDVLVVNSLGSTAQAVFVLLLLPITTALRGIPLHTLPDYLAQGGRCFTGLSPSCGADCSGAPLLPVAYVVANIAFNIAALNLLRTIGAVPMSLAMSSIVPLTILAFTLPLPYLEPTALSAGFWGGAGLLMAGLALYNWQTWSQLLAPREKLA